MTKKLTHKDLSVFDVWLSWGESNSKSKKSNTKPRDYLILVIAIPIVSFAVVLFRETVSGSDFSLKQIFYTALCLSIVLVLLEVVFNVVAKLTGIWLFNPRWLYDNKINKYNLKDKTWWLFLGLLVFASLFAIIF